MLKKTTFTLVFLSLLLVLAGCPDPGGSEPTTQDPTAFDTLEAVFDLTGKTAETVSYVYDSDTGDTVDVDGYGLDLFVTQTAVNALVDPAETTLDFRSMFAYNVVAADDYGFMTRGDALGWSVLETGYYL